MEESLIKKLVTSLKCTACGRHYDSTSVDVLGNENDLWFLKAFCKACHAEFLVAAVLQEYCDSGSGSVRSAGNSTITMDDLLEMHDYLKGFNGDFSKELKDDR